MGACEGLTNFGSGHGPVSSLRTHHNVQREIGARRYAFPNLKTLMAKASPLWTKRRRPCWPRSRPASHQPRPRKTDADRNCISNIRPGGIGYADAAFRLAHLLRAMRVRGLSGLALKDDSEQLLLGTSLLGDSCLQRGTVGLAGG
jgi:hypothetical protein